MDKIIKKPTKSKKVKCTKCNEGKINGITCVTCNGKGEVELLLD